MVGNQQNGKTPGREVECLMTREVMGHCVSVGSQHQEPSSVPRLNDAEVRKIGSVLRLLRSARRITQSDLAKQIHVQQSVISDIENGRKSVSVLQIIRLARYFGLQPAHLLALCDPSEDRESAWKEILAVFEREARTGADSGSDFASGSDTSEGVWRSPVRTRRQETASFE